MTDPLDPKVLEAGSLEYVRVLGETGSERKALLAAVAVVDHIRAEGRALPKPPDEAELEAIDAMPPGQMAGMWPAIKHRIVSAIKAQSATIARQAGEIARLSRECDAMSSDIRAFSAHANAAEERANKAVKALKAQMASTIMLANRLGFSEQDIADCTAQARAALPPESAPKEADRE